MGRCTDFGVIIKSGCDHVMQPEEASCVCPGCGSVCRGKFTGCPEVWADHDRPRPVGVAPRQAADAEADWPFPAAAPVRRRRAGSGGIGKGDADRGPNARVEPPDAPVAPAAKTGGGRRSGGGHGVAIRAERATARDVWFEAVDPAPAPVQQIDEPAPPPAPAPAPASAPEAAALEVTMAALEQRAAEMDARAAAVARALDGERARLEQQAVDQSSRLEQRAAEIEERAAAVTWALDEERRRLERMATDRSARAEATDERAAAVARALDEERARLERLATDRSASADDNDARARAVMLAFDGERARLQRLADDLSGKADEIDRRVAAHTRAFDNDRAWLERLAADLPIRARQLDDRAEAHLRALDNDRASLETVARALVARAQEIDERSDAHARAVEDDRQAIPEDVRRSLAATLPGLVAEAVRVEVTRRIERQSPPPPAGPPLRAEPDPIAEARQRSLEKRLDGVARRAQEIDERVTTHLRAIDDDRAVLADVVHHQDRLAQLIADSDGRHEVLTQWVVDTIPEAVAEGVDAAMKVKGAALSTGLGRVEKVRAETKAMADNIQETSERMLEGLFRRDQESAAQLQVLAEERAAMTAILDGGRDEIARSVVNTLPAMVEVAVRTAMERYATERRAGVQELAGRLKADSDVMREAMQRSFEKIMESIATREQALDERAAAHVKAIEEEKSVLADLWAKAALTVTDALPAMVAGAVKAADQLDRSELEAARKETEDLRAEQEAVATELRDAVAELRAALLDRDGVIARQAAAYERALDGLRAAMARQPVLAKPPKEGSAEPALVTTVVDDTNGGRVKYGRSTVPRAQRVERRMLKIDDRDDAAWPNLVRRESALADLLDADDA